MRARWFVELGLMTVRQSREEGLQTEAGIKAGVRILHRSLGIIDLSLIGTTNIDARRPVMWNVGKIAASGSPKALDLVRDILVASAAIPGAFPPMMIDVEVDGTPHQEMHVDGGASAQVFIYPPSLHVGQISSQAGITRERRAFIIRNARLDPDSGRYAAPDAQHRGAGGVVADPDAGRRRPLPHLCDDPAGRGRFQSR
ncbi:MAG: hypothetical protein HC868_10895, partial [Sphingomonadales bacterium]|nr:hypothetical protein [Sphingomonadales bacterium]